MVHPEFDLNKKTLLYLNDCFESFDESVEVIVKAYLQRRDHNILVLDWASIKHDDYFGVVIPNMERVSRMMSFDADMSASLQVIHALLMF